MGGSDGRARLDALRRHLPRAVIAPLPPAPPEPVAKVVVVGAGFAGLATAYFLCGCGFEVVVLEAQNHVGGRVSTDRDLIPGRFVEAGAELVGFNHAVWIGLAEVFGLGFMMCTDDDAYDQLGLAGPVRLGGRVLTRAEADEVLAETDKAFETLNAMAKDIDAYRPWQSPDAAALDAQSIADWKHSRDLPALVDAAIEVVIGNDNVVPTAHQSLLGFLAQIRGGGGARFWSDSEVMKCASGNQSLATHLEAAIKGYAYGSVRTGCAARAIEITKHNVVVTVDDGPIEGSHVVLATPPTVWNRIAITPAIPDTYQISTGPGVKFLSEVTSRVWLKHGLAPTALDEVIGETWEGTDNQSAAEGQTFDLSVFAGGTSAQAARERKNDVKDWYVQHLDSLFAGYAAAADGRARRFVDWPSEKWIGCGYSSPGLREVTTAARLLAQPWEKRLVFAGEHANPCFFGYMEGALQSGLLAMGHIAEANGLFTHDAVVRALTAAVDAGFKA